MALALLLLTMALIALAVAMGVATMSAWARVAAVVFEVLAVIVDVLRAGRHPFASVLSVLIAVVVIALVASIGRTPPDAVAAASPGPSR
jgi:hypothetical protein